MYRSNIARWVAAKNSSAETRPFGLKWLIVVIALLAVSMLVAPALAQRPRLLQPRAGQPRLGQPPQEEVIAAAGSPFGVGKLTIMLPRGAARRRRPGR